MDIKKITDIEVDNVYRWDFPDFADATFTRAKWIETDIELTDDELEQLAQEYPELLNEMAFESLI